MWLSLSSCLLSFALHFCIQINNELILFYYSSPLYLNPLHSKFKMTATLFLNLIPMLDNIHDRPSNSTQHNVFFTSVANSLKFAAMLLKFMQKQVSCNHAAISSN